MYGSARQKSRSAISKLLQTARDQWGGNGGGGIKHTMTSVVSEPIVIGDEPQRIIRWNEVGVLFHELYGRMTESGGVCFLVWTRE